MLKALEHAQLKGMRFGGSSGRDEAIDDAVDTLNDVVFRLGSRVGKLAQDNDTICEMLSRLESRCAELEKTTTALSSVPAPAPGFRSKSANPGVSQRRGKATRRKS
jgi:hypothetical protein